MIGELKNGMKLIKYGFNLKSFMLLGVLFYILGIVFITMVPDMFLLGGTYILLGPMMLVQIIFTLACANCVAASPYKRILEIWIPNLIGFLTLILGYSYIIVITALRIRKSPLQTTHYLSSLVCLGMLACILGIYMSAAYKSFFVSVFSFTGAYMIACSFSNILLESAKIHLTIITASVIGFGFILMGSVLSFVLSKALYKKTVSKYAVGKELRKYL